MLRAHHASQQTYVNDRQRIALLDAERKFRALEVFLECIEVSDHGRNYVLKALSVIRRALDLTQPRPTTCPVAAEETG